MVSENTYAHIQHHDKEKALSEGQEEDKSTLKLCDVVMGTTESIMFAMKRLYKDPSEVEKLGLLEIVLS